MTTHKQGGGRYVAIAPWIVSVVLLLISMGPISARQKCDAKYSDRVKNEIVGPALRNFVGPYFRFYDLAKPDIAPYPIDKRLLQLTFRPVSGQRLDSIDVVFDPCAKRAWVPRGPIL